MKSPTIHQGITGAKKSQGQRRLDTLARLLESDMTCAAVCLIDDELLITTNTLYAKFDGRADPALKEPGTKGYRFLKEAVSHFVSPAFKQSEQFIVADTQIILKTYLGKFSGFYKGQPDAPNLTEGQISRIIDSLLTAESTQSFMQSNTLDFFEQFLFAENDGQEARTKARQKPVDFFNKLIDVQRTFSRVWRDVRDYRKFKQMVVSGNLVINSYNILSVGQKDEHAEMRLTGYLLNHPSVFQPDQKLLLIKPIYLGISKLCCPYCVKTLVVLNRNLELNKEIAEFDEHDGLVLQVADNRMMEDDVLYSSSASLSEAADIAFAEELEREQAMLDARGSHELRFKWLFPAFSRQPLPAGQLSCHKLTAWGKLPANPENNTLYYVETKTHDIARCGVYQTTSIDCIGKGAKKRFELCEEVVELGIYKKHIKGKAIDVNLVQPVCRYYGEGFVHQATQFHWEQDEVMTTCVRLEENARGQANMSALQQLRFDADCLAGYEEVNDMVVLPGEVKMVPSVSSSSVGGDSEDKIEGGRVIISALRRVDILHQFSEESEDAQDAEKSKNQSSEISAQKSSDFTSGDVSDEEEQNYNVRMKK